MSLTEQVCAQAKLLAGELTPQQETLLTALCTGTTSILQSRLRRGIRPEDCKADFIAAASLLALADLDNVREGEQMEQITAGDLTLRRGKRAAASNCLRAQAEMLIGPYLKDRFSFRGV